VQGLAGRRVSTGYCWGLEFGASKGRGNSVAIWGGGFNNCWALNVRVTCRISAGELFGELQGEHLPKMS